MASLNSLEENQFESILTVDLNTCKKLTAIQLPVLARSIEKAVIGLSLPEPIKASKPTNTTTKDDEQVNTAMGEAGTSDGSAEIHELTGNVKYHFHSHHFDKAMIGRKENTTKLVMKVKRKKSTNEIISQEILGKITTNYIFDKPFDYQVS